MKIRSASDRSCEKNFELWKIRKNALKVHDSKPGRLNKFDWGKIRMIGAIEAISTTRRLISLRPQKSMQFGCRKIQHLPTGDGTK
jgi:hypothetical protein